MMENQQNNDYSAPRWAIVEVMGHRSHARDPSVAELSQGWSSGKRPVSLHNVWCDLKCTRLCAGMKEAAR